MHNYPVNILNAQCPSRKVFEMLGNKWTLLVLAAISRGINRHNQLLREINGISQKMLAQTLRSLERDGILLREVYPVMPPMVEYHITSVGASLISAICQLGAWAEHNVGSIEAARLRYDASEQT